MNDEKYVVIKDWMVEQLDLKGNKLIIYAIIHGFSQTEGNYYTGGLSYLCKWTNSTKQGVLKALKELLKEGLIQRENVEINGVNFVKYWSTKFNGVVNKVEWGGKQSLIGGSTKFNDGGKLSLPNNIYNNIYNNINNNKDNIKDNSNTNKPKKQKISWV